MTGPIAAAAPAQREERRLRASMALSLLLHAGLILGVGFALEDAAPVLPTLDVIISQTQSPLTRQQADFLAQVSNSGGGDHDKSSRPRDAQAGLVPQPEEGVAPQTLRAQTPEPSPAAHNRVIAARDADTVLPTPRQRPEVDPSRHPRGPQKVEHDLAMARLAAEIHLRSQRYAKRPKRKFVSASTREYAYATYLRGWVDRVERVGNLNYPEQARQRRIGGILVISVAIRKDGSVERADVIQSSNVPMLDAAALRIVRLAEPFAPLPRTTEDIDVLHVTRTWQFLPGGELIDD